MRCFCEVKMGKFWSNDSLRNGASSSCSCLNSATDFGFPQIAVHRNVKIIWGVGTLQSARNNNFFAFPHAGKFKGKRGANRCSRDLFTGLLCFLCPAVAHLSPLFLTVFGWPTATPITPWALARPRCSHRAAAAPGPHLRNLEIDPVKDRQLSMITELSNFIKNARYFLITGGSARTTKFRKSHRQLSPRRILIPWGVHL